MSDGLRLPFAGLRVVELGNVIAGPLCGSLMADFGADVVKVERRDGGDPGRHLGPDIDGTSVWWGVGARDKRCVALDLKNDDDRHVFLDLIRDADVLIENNRPGALDRLQLGRPDLERVNPSLVMLSISGFGQTGPMAKVPGFGKIAEAFSGIVPLTGDPASTPLHVGFSLADASASLFGLLGISTALWARDCGNGGGEQIDLALYEPLFRMSELQAAQFEAAGEAPARSGSSNPYGWGAADDDSRLVGATCRDGVEVVVLVDADAMPRLAGLIGSENDVDAGLRAWAAARSCEEVARETRAAGLEAARIQDGLSLAQDPYFRTRGDVLDGTLPSGRDITVPGHVLRQLADRRLQPFRAAELAQDQGFLVDGAWGDADTR